MNSPENDEGAGIRRALRLVGLVGFLVSAGILTGTWAGIKLEARFQTGGIATASGIFLGLFAGVGLAAGLLLREARMSGPGGPAP